MTTTTTMTIHLQISEVEQATPTTRQTPTIADALAGSGATENELGVELEEVALRRLHNPGALVDATTILPELAT